MDVLQSFNRLMAAVMGVVKERGGESFLANCPVVMTLFEIYARYSNEVMDDLRSKQLMGFGSLSLEKKLQKIVVPTGRTYEDMTLFVKEMTRLFGKTRCCVCCKKQTRSASS